MSGLIEGALFLGLAIGAVGMAASMLPTMSTYRTGLALGTRQIGDMPELWISWASRASTLLAASTR
jgi:hypothetical protein